MVDTYKITISPYIDDYDDEEHQIEREFIQSQLNIKPFTEEEIKASVETDIVKYSVDIANLLFKIPSVTEVASYYNGIFEITVNHNISSYEEFKIDLENQIGRTGNIQRELDFGEFTTYTIEKI